METERKEDYVWEGDTWFLLDLMCPDCGNRPIRSNSKIRECDECGWWIPLDELNR